MEKAKPFKLTGPGGLKDHTGRYSESGKVAPRLADVYRNGLANGPLPGDALPTTADPRKDFGPPPAQRKPFRVG